MAETTSYSETQRYLECKRAHYYNYVEKIEPIVTKSSMEDGTIGHEILAVYYELRKRGFDYDESVLHAHIAFELSDYKHDPSTKRADLELMLFGYYFPNEPFAQHGYKVLAVEKEFDLTWTAADGTEQGYKFVIDLILRDPTGQILIVDHKFTGRFTTQEMGLLLPQLPLYMAGIRGKGLPVDYALYNEINMTLVKTKRTVDQALHQLPIIPTPERVVNTFETQVDAAAEIRVVKEMAPEAAKRKALRSINKISCNMCSYKSICIGELSGSNTELIRRTDYQPKTKRDAV